jgi:alkylhydroperoxidase/carboxymuconolactone decarboxylase family protein YurZ
MLPASGQNILLPRFRRGRDEEGIMTDPEAIAAAEKVIGPVLAKTMQEQISEGTPLGDVGKLAAELVFRDVWGRPGLDNHARALTTLGVLIGKKRLPILRYYARIALRNGVTPDQLDEVALQAIPYAGFPTAVAAAQIMRSVAAEVAAEPAG